jgi:hypothetical protein
MANEDAWDIGWKAGSGATKKKKSTKSTDDSGGGDAWGAGWKAGSGKASKRKVQSFKHGGKVQKTGIYRLHKGEMVVPLKKAKAKQSRKRASTKK